MTLKQHIIIIIITGIKCGLLKTPKNGFVNYTSGISYGDSATYHCDAGYTIIGDNQTVCQINGQWSAFTPVCARKKN